MNYYEGEFYNGHANGQGKRSETLKNQPDFINFAQKEFAPCVRVYQGNFMNDSLHGYGKATFTNGLEYEGTWMNDQFHGVGMLKNSQFKYSGEFILG